MESQSQNPEFRNNPENFHPCSFLLKTSLQTVQALIRESSDLGLH